MIQLSSQNLLVIDEASGDRISLDIEGLRAKLRQAFQECTIDQEWIANNLLDVLEEKVRLCISDGLELTIEDVHRILINVLTATGFSDVARVFATLCAAPPPGSPEELDKQLKPWSGDQLTALLKRSLPLSEYQLAYLHKALPEVLATLAFSGASETLVLELSRHLIHFRCPNPEPPVAAAVVPSPTAPPEPAAAPAVSPLAMPTKYIAADRWQLPLSAPLQALLKGQLIKLLPVSDILPIAVVECHLERVFDLPHPPRLELELQARLKTLSGQLLEVLSLMRKRMEETWPAITNPATHVRFASFATFLQLASPSRKKKDRQAFGVKMQELLKVELNDAAPFPISLSYC